MSELLAYQDVLKPLLSLLDLTYWEGIPWDWFQATTNLKVKLGSTHVIGFKWLPPPVNRPIVGAELYNPDQCALATPDQRDQWAAMCAWSRWHYDVATSLGMKSAPKDWLILSTYPGRREHLPASWVRAARELNVPWSEWQRITELAHRGLIPLDSKTIEVGLRTPKETGMLAPLPRVVGRPRSVVETALAHRETPEEWRPALRAFLSQQGLSDQSIRVYASHIRRVLREAGIPDFEECRKAAALLGNPYRSVWSRFEQVALTGSHTPMARSVPLPLAGRPKGLDKVEAFALKDAANRTVKAQQA